MSGRGTTRYGAGVVNEDGIGTVGTRTTVTGGAGTRTGTGPAGAGRTAVTGVAHVVVEASDAGLSGSRPGVTEAGVRGVMGVTDVSHVRGATGAAGVTGVLGAGVTGTAAPGASMARPAVAGPAAAGTAAVRTAVTAATGATGAAVTGTAVLLAAAPAGRGRVMDAASVLPALAAVPPGVLTGTTTATVVELADPLDPQTVLTRLRAAAASPGPMVLCLAGQLHLDRRQGLPHLALARTTPATLRYTALPWHWLAGELGVRPPGTTTVVADLAADPAVWERLATTPDLLHLGPGSLLYGRVAPARAGANR